MSLKRFRSALLLAVACTLATVAGIPSGLASRVVLRAKGKTLSVEVATTGYSVVQKGVLGSRTTTVPFGAKTARAAGPFKLSSAKLLVHGTRKRARLSLDSRGNAAVRQFTVRLKTEPGAPLLLENSVAGTWTGQRIISEALPRASFDPRHTALADAFRQMGSLLTPSRDEVDQTQFLVAQDNLRRLGLDLEQQGNVFVLAGNDLSVYVRMSGAAVNLLRVGVQHPQGVLTVHNKWGLEQVEVDYTPTPTADE